MKVKDDLISWAQADPVSWRPILQYFAPRRHTLLNAKLCVSIICRCPNIPSLNWLERLDEGSGYWGNMAIFKYSQTRLLGPEQDCNKAFERILILWNRATTYCICATDMWFDIARSTEYIACFKLVGAVLSLSLNTPKRAAKRPCDTVGNPHGKPSIIIALHSK